MASPTIKVKRSSVAGKIPTTSQLDLGELALNTFDGKVYLEQDQSSVGVGTTVIVINPWSVGTGTNTYNTYFTAGNIGVGSTLPTSKFHVVGNALITGIATISGLKFPISDGTTGQVIKTDGQGNLTFGNVSSSVGLAKSITDQYHTATQNQTVFTSSQDFTNKSVQIFANGLKLRQTTDYSLTSPSTVTLTNGLSAGDRLNIIVSFGYTLDEENFTSTQGQTIFNLSGSFSSADNIKIYVNGVKLRSNDYSSTSSISLLTAASVGDEIDLVCDNDEDYFTATQGQTTFIPTSTSITATNIQVFLNGIKLEPLNDFNINSPTITLTNGLNAGDEVDIVISRS